MAKYPFSTPKGSCQKIPVFLMMQTIHVSWFTHHPLYPLVNSHIAIENDHRNSGFSHCFNGGSFHSYVAVYQRVTTINIYQPLSIIHYTTHHPLYHVIKAWLIHWLNPHVLMLKHQPCSADRQTGPPDIHQGRPQEVPVASVEQNGVTENDNFRRCYGWDFYRFLQVSIDFYRFL